VGNSDERISFFTEGGRNGIEWKENIVRTSEVSHGFFELGGTASATSRELAYMQTTKANKCYRTNNSEGRMNRQHAPRLELV
jgi:hypothetical protein